MAFCSFYGVIAFPATGSDLVDYSAWLILTGRINTAGSLRQYLSNVRSLHKEQGLICPTPTEFGPLEFVVKGVERRFAAPTKKSLPITPEILAALVQTTLPPTSSWESQATLCAMRSAAIILFFSMLRSSNLFPKTIGSKDELRQLTWRRVTRVEEGAVLSIVVEKTIQHLQKVHEIALSADPQSPLCPVSALQSIISMRGSNISLDDLVLQAPLGRAGTWRPILKHEFVAWFRARLEQLQLPASKFSAHGFRIGALQTAVLHEPNLTLVKISSNHISDAVYGYLNVNASRRMQVARKMLAAMPAQHSESAARLAL